MATKLESGADPDTGGPFAAVTSADPGPGPNYLYASTALSAGAAWAVTCSEKLW
jgi:hypothetical protein